MRDALSPIRKHRLPVGVALIALVALWLVGVFGDQVGVRLNENVSMLALAIGGGLLAAFIAPEHPLRSGMLGGAAPLALAWATRAVHQAVAGKVNVGEYGSWETYWLTSLFALIAFAVMGAVLGYVGGYVVRLASRQKPRMHTK